MRMVFYDECLHGIAKRSGAVGKVVLEEPKQFLSESCPFSQPREESVMPVNSFSILIYELLPRFNKGKVFKIMIH
jgi:hypothetical protein